MTSPAEIPDVSVLALDPHPVFAELRRREAATWIPGFNGWLVTRRDECIAAMRDDETFTVDDRRFSTARVIGPSMLSLDGSEHDRHRSPFADPFRSAAVRDRFSEWITARAAGLVGELAPAGAGDLRATIAAPLAVDVMSRALDLTGVEVDDLLGWYDAIVDAVEAVTAGDPVPGAGHRAFDALERAVTESLDTSTLLAPVRSAGSLSDDEIVANVAVLLFGGIVTAESTTASVLWYLLHDPATMRTILDDRSLVQNAVEEGMRLEPAAAAVDRYATRSVELGGVAIAAGDLVRVSLAAANRDPAVFDDPDRFDVHRSNAQQHLTFARGPHACLGIHLARLEARAAVDAVLDGLAGLELDAERDRPIEGLIFRAPPVVAARW